MRKSVLVTLVALVALLALLAVASARHHTTARVHGGRLLLKGNCIGSCGGAKKKPQQSAKAQKGQAAAPDKPNYTSTISGATDYTYSIFPVDSFEEAVSISGSFKNNVLYIVGAQNNNAGGKPTTPGLAELGIADLIQLYGARWVEITTANENWEVYYYFASVGNNMFGDAEVALAEMGRRFQALGHKVEKVLDHKPTGAKEKGSDLTFVKSDKDQVKATYNKLMAEFQEAHKDYAKAMGEAFKKYSPDK